MPPKRERKHSYVVPCSSEFRDAITALADIRGVNVADIARSVMLIVPTEIIQACPDAGEPPAGDRESVVLKSGPSQGKPWRRKPRLQVRLPKGHAVADIRRALGLALAIDHGDIEVTLEDGRSPRARDLLREARNDVERIRGALTELAYSPIERGIETNADALYVLGFWFILQFISQGGGVAYAAHIGGFVSGMILILFFNRKVKKKNKIIKGPWG